MNVLKFSCMLERCIEGDKVHVCGVESHYQFICVFSQVEIMFSGSRYVLRADEGIIVLRGLADPDRHVLH